MKAQKLWFAILESQTETGTPYMLYKDSCNRKSNQQVYKVFWFILKGECFGQCIEFLNRKMPEENTILAKILETNHKIVPFWLFFTCLPLFLFQDCTNQTPIDLSNIELGGKGTRRL